MAADQMNDVIAHNLRREIVRLGISQSELARRAGMYPAEITAYVSGRKDMRLSTVERLAKGLDIHFMQLLLPISDSSEQPSAVEVA